MFFRAVFMVFFVAVNTASVAYAQQENAVLKIQLQYAEFLKRGQFDQALILNDKALSICPESGSAPLWHERGLILSGLKRYDEALIAFDKALSLRQSARYLTSKGNTLSEMKKFPEAMEYFAHALQLEPENAGAYAARAAAEVCMQQLDPALADINKSIQLNPNAAEPYVTRATLQNKRHKYAEAQADTSKAIQLNPNDASAYGEKAFAFWGSKNKEQAVQNAEKATKLDPSYRATFEKMRNSAIAEPLEGTAKVLGDPVIIDKQHP